MATGNGRAKDDKKPGVKLSPLTLKVARETMTGDLRDAALQWIKQLQKPWQQLSEADQRIVIESVTKGAAFAVARAVDILAAGDFVTIDAALEQYSEKDGLKATLTLIATDESVLALHKAKGTRVRLVVSDARPFDGERKPAKPEPDQKPIPGTEAKDAKGAPPAAAPAPAEGAPAA